MRFLQLSFLVATWWTAVVLAYPIDRRSSFSDLAIREGLELDGVPLALRFDAGDVQSLEARQPNAKEAAKKAMKGISRAMKKSYIAIMDRISPHKPEPFDSNKMVRHSPPVHESAAHGVPQSVFQKPYIKSGNTRPTETPYGPRPQPKRLPSAI
ncbi:hypothetical protein BJ912DRAFT_1043124 [Pholiota molesta]|nr:hypothetical protein BJ912DRAFT_1043124 [Pholiota molesta]